MGIRSGLRRICSGRRGVFEGRAGREPFGGVFTRRWWVLGRALCLYRCEDFPGVTRGRRARALALRVPVLSPFERTGWHAVWAGARAMVWLWDEAAVGPVAAGDRSGLRPLPETVLRPRKGDGLHVQACREGFELQRWREGVLEASLWVPERGCPAEVAWGLGEGAGLEEAPEEWPAAREASLWPGARGAGARLEAAEGALRIGLVMALGVALGWQEVRHWRFAERERAVGEALRAVDERLGPVLAARGAYERARAENEALSALLGAPTQARLTFLVDRALPGAAGRFREWRYEDGVLALVVADPAPDPVPYVRGLEAEPWFGDVHVEPAASQGGESRLTVRLKVRRP